MSESSLQTVEDLRSGNWETVSTKKMAARYVSVSAKCVCCADLGAKVI